MSAKIYKRVLQGGLIASFVIVFFVFQDLLFPYITSKQLSFNILMEMLLAVWLVLILRYPEYRPRRNYIIGGLVAFLLAILASCAVSVDVGLSFWGDAERIAVNVDSLYREYRGDGQVTPVMELFALMAETRDAMRR